MKSEYPGAQHVNKRAHPQSEQRLQQAVKRFRTDREETASADTEKSQILPDGAMQHNQIATDVPLKNPTAAAPPGCHCGDVCMAPKVMGRQLRCRREQWEGPAYEYGVTWGPSLDTAQAIEAAIVSELDRQCCAYGGIDTEKLAGAVLAVKDGGDEMTAHLTREQMTDKRIDRIVLVVSILSFFVAFQFFLAVLS